MNFYIFARLKKMKKVYKKNWRKFKIHCQIYDFELYVIISKDNEKILKYCKWHFEDEDYKKDFSENLGCFLSRYNYKPLIILKGKPKTPREFGTFAHEVAHCAYYILSSWAGMKLSPESEEAYCHLQSFLIREILKKI